MEICLRKKHYEFLDFPLGTFLEIGNQIAIFSKDNLEHIIINKNLFGFVYTDLSRFSTRSADVYIMHRNKFKIKLN